MHVVGAGHVALAGGCDDITRGEGSADMGAP
jgi:hypothetical protein